MRGSDTRSGELFSYVDLEQQVPSTHPLRKIRQLVSDVLSSLDGEFARSLRRQDQEAVPACMTEPLDQPQKGIRILADVLFSSLLVPQPIGGTALDLCCRCRVTPVADTLRGIARCKLPT